jgi:hypothetical protein
MGVLEQRLGRDTSPDQAGPAERLLLLDDGDLHSKLGSADGGNITTRTSANHDDVMSSWQGDSLDSCAATARLRDWGKSPTAF